MNTKEFLKQEGINEVDEGCLHYNDDAECVNERILTELLEKYHQAKLKLLGIPDVSNSVCECCNENEAKVLVKLCHVCEEYRLS